MNLLRSRTFHRVAIVVALYGLSALAIAMGR
jgi:hypothetical protein